MKYLEEHVIEQTSEVNDKFTIYRCFGYIPNYWAVHLAGTWFLLQLTFLTLSLGWLTGLCIYFGILRVSFVTQ